jgi:transcriptional regulator with XRE-family HTH domain
MKLGVVLKAYRLSHVLPSSDSQAISIRTLADRIGISAPTLSRIENGKMCDAETLMKVFNWLMESQ